MTAQTIHVTADHIRSGEPENCEECPIALAIAEAWAGAGVEVSQDEIWLWPVWDSLGGCLTAQTPSEVRAFITAYDSEDYDREDAVKPFTFTVEWTAGNYDQEPAA